MPTQERVARQVVIGDQHVDARAHARRDALDARDAVVDGDDQAGRLSAASATISGVSP